MAISGQALKLIQIFLNDTLWRAVVNDQFSAWTPMLASVSQDSILWALFFLIYINDRAEGISSTAKLFVDDTRIFCCQWHQCTSWPNLEEMSVVLSVENVIHLDNSKQAQEITYSKKKRNFLHPPFLQWKNMVGCSYHKYLGVYLDKKLNFQQHIKKKIAKPSIIFGLQNTGFHVMGQI